MSIPDPPARSWRWELSGAGLENLALVERETPQPGSDELLVRIDACGICFSDIKILNLGPDHPRLQGRNLQKNPVVMGHETAMTVLQVGDAVRDRFQPGQRFLIQADVYYQGAGMAFGYRLAGGYSQYQVIPGPVLAGDEGCYLLPAAPHVSHSQAALCEPWACVEAAYCYQPRRAVMPDGHTLIVVLETQEISDVLDEVAHGHGVSGLTPGSHPWLQEPDQVPAGVAELRERHADGFDDILIYGRPKPQLIEGLTKLLKPGGVLGLQEGRAGVPGSAGVPGRATGPSGRGGPAAVDIGSIHYRNHWYTGSPTGDLYAWGRTTELLPGGTAWFIGAGGPLGQMHLQRALSLPRPPARMLISQNGGPRLEDLRRRFSGPAAERGVELVFLDPRELGEGIYDTVREVTAGRGCDDICVIIPNARVVERAFELLAPGGGLDVFAGVAVGTTARLDVGRVAADGVRLWGTSGSSIADLRQIVEKVERGVLATDRVVAAVGGIEAVREGLEAVREGIFLGKTVIYPHCQNLPLLTVEELAERHPSVRERLADGRYWTPEAEGELMRLYSCAE